MQDILALRGSELQRICKRVSGRVYYRPPAAQSTKIVTETQKKKSKWWDLIAADTRNEFSLGIWAIDLQTKCYPDS